MFYDIVEDAYRAFECDTPKHIDVCEGCCMYPDVEVDFFNPKIRELPIHYLQDWFFAAPVIEGVSKQTWRYLLPRILEALARDEEIATVGLEVSLNRFPTGVRDNWNDSEWSVLDRFQRCYLGRELSRNTGYLDDTLCMFGLAGWPMSDLLAQISEFPDHELARRFWNDWCVGYPTIWITAFWEDGKNTEVFNFYTSRALYLRMEKLAFAQDTNPKLAEKALEVAAVIEANADWAL